LQQVINLILESGESGIELALYVIVPIMVVMMGIMKLLEDAGILNRIAGFIAPVLRVFGLPGLGVFAILQCLLISFAAPVATVKLMDRDKYITGPNIAATLAAVFTISQANATFPLAVEGLNLPVVFATSIAGGLLSGLIAHKISKKYYTRGKAEANDQDHSLTGQEGENESAAGGQGPGQASGGRLNVFKSLLGGAEEGFWIGVKAAPILIFSLFVVNILRVTSAIELLETLLTPLLTQVNIPGIAVLPIVTKFLAGGTAMMGITMDLMREGSLTALQLNRIAGLGIHAIDPVAISLYAAIGLKVGRQIKPALMGASVGIGIRTVLHLLLF